jgi:hypothetical protein
MNEHAAAKAGAAWGGYGFAKYLEALGVHSWSDFAGMAAGLYSLLLIADWVWKKYRAWRADRDAR